MRLLLIACLPTLFACSGDDNAQNCGDAACPSEGGAIDGSADVIATDGGDGGDAALTTGGRLFVAVSKPSADAGVAGTILVWDDINGLTTAAAPSFSLSNATMTTQAALIVANQLVTAPSGGGLTVFAEAKTLTASAAPSVSFGNGYVAYDRLAYSAGPDALWGSHTNQGTYRYDQGASLSATSKATMLFAATTSTFVYDEKGDRAYTSDQGIYVWNNGKSVVGSGSASPKSDFTLDATFGAGSMAIAQDRLYALGGSSSAVESIAVWNGISSVTAAKAPDFTITAGNSNGTAGSVATPGTLLIVCQNFGVGVWKNAASLTADTSPDFSLTTQIVNPQKVVFAPSTDRLYVLDSKGVAIYASASTNPTFVTKLVTPSMPHDLAVIE